MAEFFRIAWLVMRKDIRVESRSREMIYTTTFFAVSCVLVFSFAFVRGGAPVEGAEAGIIWVALAYAGQLALGRAFERELHHDALRGLLLAPAERSAIFVGKLLGIILLMVVVEAVVIFFVALFFDAPLFAHPFLMIGLLAAGTLGFAAVGALFAAMLTRTESRAVLLPVLLYPITVPVLIAGVSGTISLIQLDPNLDLARFWLALIVFFDAVFLTLALWTFEPLMTE
ncbi:MAG: heme transporter [Acidobacteria bacterium]|nr:heme transporter [Acidobacteriota bacterium]MYD70890.1 heme transporter [Acidobacteriota bacterium]MYJ05202.1 heme transporter [Acidobacteriota bacterium]